MTYDVVSYDSMKSSISCQSHMRLPDPLPVTAGDDVTKGPGVLES